ncbi:MAG TPA: hypothetical protein VGC31_05355, partial [Paenirhodobacter sp.]
MEQGQANPEREHPEREGSEPKRGSTGGLIAGGGAAIVVIAALFGLWAYQGGHPAAVAVPSAAVQPAPGGQAPVAQKVSPAVPAPQAANPVPVPAADAVPKFDMLRAGQDGTITVAGMAAPGVKVEVLLDGQVIDTVLAGADGKFASVTLGAPSAEPRSLTLRSAGAGGMTIPSAESLTVAPSQRVLEQAAQAAGGSAQALADLTGQAAALAARPLLADAQGVRVLAQGSDDLVIDTLAFDADQGVEISGRGAPAGSVLRAYIDNAEVGLIAAGTEGGWRMLLPAPAPGGHQLRVDALDATGKVLSRAETGFTATRRDALDAAARPEDGDGTSKIIT